MNPHPCPNTPITRRNWLALAASALAGCGGGGADVAQLPGTGGTGIFAQGAIAGFGSVIVNGIKFDDAAAAVQIDGVAASSLNLRLGMVASVQGQRSADPTLGSASRIDVWSIAQGRVTQVQAGRFMVAGMTVQTDSATVYDGVGSASGLAAGQPVAVWGLQAQADASRWIATRVAVLADTAAKVVSTGLVTVAGSQRSLNGLPLSGSLAASMAVGQLVRAKGTLSGASLQVDEYKVLELPNDALSSRQVELEGVVTQVLSTTRFMLGNIEVDSSAVAIPPATPIATGLRIEVHGTLQGQRLKADALAFESDLKLDEAEIEGLIEQFTSLANFVVRGQRCDATGAVFKRGRPVDLKVGVKVKVEGTKAGDFLKVTRLEIGD